MQRSGMLPDPQGCCRMCWKPSQSANGSLAWTGEAPSECLWPACMKNEQKTSVNAPRSGGCIQNPASGAAEGPRSILFREREKKKITCTISESRRGKGFKTSKVLQIAINTLNYPASLKAFILLFLPEQEQAPDCGCLEWNIQEGVEPEGQEKWGGWRGGGGRKRLGCPGTLSPAGWQETAAIVQVCCLQRAVRPRRTGAADPPGSWGKSTSLMKTEEKNGRAARAA